MEHGYTPPQVYQFRVVVQGISPLIWRRLLVRSDMSLATLHATLQIVFAWSDLHLHYFRIHGREYGSTRPGGPSFDVDPRHVPIAALRLHRGERLTYVYNFIDHWVCDLRLEAIVPLDPRRFYPVCTGGKRAAPPEDCGGAWAYMQLVDRHHVPLEAMAVVATVLNRLLEADGQTTIRQVIGDRDTFREAVAQLDAYLQFQPEHVDRRQINAQLQTLPQAQESRHEMHNPGGDHDREWPDRHAGDCLPGAGGPDPTTLGLTLAEGKTILKALQAVVVEQQMTAYLETQRPCADCGIHQRSKGYHTMQVRTVFGTISVQSPRLHQCSCLPHPTKTFSPLAALLPEHLTPKLLFLETKWAALVSYGVTAELLQDVLPIDDALAPCTIREHVFKVAERLEQALGEEQWSFIDSCPAEWSRLPIPNGPLTVGIDGGYVRAQPKQGWFEVIAGKSLLAFIRGEESEESVSSKCFAFVQTFDQKPKRRLFEVLQSQGHQLNQQITFLSDGGDTVRELQLYLNPHAEHLLDWFHVTMRLTVLQQTAKGLPDQTRDEEVDYPLRDPVVRDLERLKWYLWHGNVYKALQVAQSVEM